MELRVGNEKKHTYLVAKSKTGPNKENRPYNQIKTCMCVEFFLNGTHTLICMTQSFILRYGLSFLFSFSFSYAFGHRYFFLFVSHSPYSFCNMKSHVKMIEHFCVDESHIFCATSEVGTRIYGVYVILIIKA